MVLLGVRPPPYRFGLWVLGLAISFGTPLSAGRLHGEIPPYESHLPERFGLFTIIVLGESVVGLVGGAVEQAWSPRSFLVGGVCLGIVFCLWWLYFEDVDGSRIRAAVEADRTGIYQEWLYAHLPLAVCLASLAVVHYTGEARTDRRFTVPSLARLGGALAALLLGAFGAGLSPLVVVSLLGLASIVPVVLDAREGYVRSRSPAGGL